MPEKEHKTLSLIAKLSKLVISIDSELVAKMKWIMREGGGGGGGGWGTLSY